MQIDTYPYSVSRPRGENKPVPVERKHIIVEVHVKQTAATMLTLLGILPLILGTNIKADDTH